MDVKRVVDADVVAGLKVGLMVGLALVALILLNHARWPFGVATVPVPAHPQLDLRDEEASTDVRQLAQWVLDSGDHGGRSFVLVDKKMAKVFVFEPSGRLVAATPVLLGFAVGDDTVPGIAERPLAAIRPEERTTPAGRFVSQAGRNAENEDVIWVDYGAAVSMHRVRQVHASERRLERLQSPTLADHRISSGCINVPVAFFDQVLWPRLGGAHPGVIYVLPETRALTAVFPALQAAAAG